MFKKKKFYLILGLLLLAGVGYWRWQVSRQPKIEYSTAKVIKGQLVQTVSETGSVTPLNELQLNFQSSGKIASINVKVGDQIKKDQPLAALDAVDLQIRLNQAEAQLAASQASLNKLLAGAAGVDLNVSQASVNSAQAAADSAKADLGQVDQTTLEAVKQAQKNLDDLRGLAGVVTPLAQSINQASTNLDNAKRTYRQNIDSSLSSLFTAVKNKLPLADSALDSIDRVLTDQDAQNLLSVRDAQALSNTRNDYNLARTLAASAKLAASSMQSGQETSVRQVYDTVYPALNTTFTALNDCFNALQASIVGGNFSQTDLDTFKNTISAQITAVSNAVSSLEAAHQSLDNASLAYTTNVSAAQNSLAQAQASWNDALTKSSDALHSAQLSREHQLSIGQSQVQAAFKALQVAQAQYNKLVAAARPEDVDLARAQLRQSQASLDLIRNQLANNQIIAPVDGVITEVNYKVGEQTAVGQPAFKMIAKDGYEVEIDVAETDIAKIKVHDVATITLDAYGDSVKLSGSVVSVEPAATIIQGVIYYKVKIDFVGGQVAIKPSMTATASIATASKDNVLYVPARAVLDNNGQKYVRVLANGAVVEKNVTVGLSGDDGLLEILTGLNEGEEAVTFVKNSATASGK
ncbi:MAG: efflux RND transporter periplasmic adaptor subunit [Candidatus Falkowbacteria bacterium]